MADSTIYYFYSTAAQSIAAITALSAAVAVFRYQTLLNLKAEMAKTIIGQFNSSGLKHLIGLKEKAEAFLNTAISDSHKADLLTVCVLKDGAREALLKRIAELNNPNTGIYNGMPESFDRHKIQFGLYSDVRAKIDELRAGVLISTVFGLVMVGLGIFATLMPENGWSSNWRNGAATIYGLLIWFFLLSIGAVIKASFPKQD